MRPQQDRKGGIGAMQQHTRLIRIATCVLSLLTGYYLVSVTMAGTSPCETQTIPQTPLSGMVWIPGGEFTMGSSLEIARADEKPAHRVRVEGFWMDANEVTNQQFRTFVEATGYVTTAEKAPDLQQIMAQLPPGTPPPSTEMFVPGSIVFVTPSTLGQPWWEWRRDVNWRHPDGPGSSITGKDDYPVVQVSWFDAQA